MSMALDVSLALHVHCGRVSCFARGGRFWQDGDRFSNVCALSVKADVLNVHKHTHAHTHTHMHCSKPVSGEFALSSVVCRLLSAENREGKIFSLEHLQTLKVRDFVPGFCFNLSG